MKNVRKIETKDRNNNKLSNTLVHCGAIECLKNTSGICQAATISLHFDEFSEICESFIIGEYN